MQIQIQLCCFIIMLLLLVIYASHKRLKLSSEIVFLRSIILTTLMLAFDITTVAMIYYMDALDLRLVEWACRLYIISIVWVAGSVVLYVLSDVLPRKKITTFKKYFDIVTVLESVLVAVLPIEISNRFYSYGMAVNTVYAIASVDFCLAFFCLAYFRSRLNSRRIFGVLLWLAIWISFASIQFVHNDMLIVGFAVTLGMIILFVLLENPEAKLDRKFGCFNYYTLMSYLHSLFEDKAEFSVVAIFVNNLAQVSESSVERSSRVLLGIARRYSKVRVFKNVNWEFVCVSETPSQINALVGELLGSLSHDSSELGDLTLVCCQDAGQFNNEYELSQACKFARDTHSENARLKIVSKEIIEAYHRRRFLEHEIEKALLQDRVEIFFQPIYSTFDKQFVSAEVLARIRLVDGDYLMPGEFIPVAEKCGKIYDLGISILEQVCAFLKNNPNVVSSLNINLSNALLKDERFGKQVLAIMDKYGIVAEQLVFEMPETIPAKAMIVQMKNLEILLRKGIRFAMDNFGRDDFNLMRLVDMHLSYIKLDMDLCKAFFREKKFVHVIEATQKLAQDLNLKIIASGIESEKEFKGMQDQKIEYIQGFYFTKPLPKEEFTAFLDLQQR